MSEFFGFKNLRGQLEPDDHNRYIRLDGSRYGSEGFKRFVTSPSLIGWVMGDAALSAIATSALSDGPLNAGLFLRCFGAIGLLGSSEAALVGLYLFNRRLPVSKASVIDKTGRLPPNPSATLKARWHLIKAASFSLGATGLFVPGLLMDGLPYNTTVVLVRLFTTMLMTGTLPLAGWGSYASFKLGRGDWTLSTEPPPRQMKRAAPAAPRFKLAPN